MSDKKITKLFFDFEFTGLHRNTTPISIGIVSDCGKKFYAEFNDYDKSQCDDWINHNVIKNLLFNEYYHHINNDEENNTFYIKHGKLTIQIALKEWLSQFKNIEFWGDCIVWDWILMIDLIMDGEIMRKPLKNFTTNQPFDIFSILKAKGLNPKEQRHILANVDSSENRHNSMYDAIITQKIYDRLINMG